MNRIEIKVVSELKEVVRLGVCVAEELEVRKESPELWDEMKRACEEACRAYTGKELSEINGVVRVRRMFHALGIDPTKTRPSSEALLRRVLKGQGLYRINTVVDVNNLCSLRFLLPMGVYDLEKVQPPIELCLGRNGESYQGIGRERVNVDGRPILSDAIGPFGSPMADSERTMITLESQAALLIIFAPADYLEGDLLGHVEEAGRLLVAHNWGRLIYTG